MVHEAVYATWVGVLSPACHSAGPRRSEVLTGRELKHKDSVTDSGSDQIRPRRCYKGFGLQQAHWSSPLIKSLCASVTIMSKSAVVSAARLVGCTTID
jgi:hypothetical protein